MGIIIESMWGICGPPPGWSAHITEAGSAWAFSQCPECERRQEQSDVMEYCSKYFRAYDIVTHTGEEMVMENAKSAVAVEREKEIPNKIDGIAKLISENAALIAKLDGVLTSVTQGLPDVQQDGGQPTTDAVTSMGGVLADLDESLYRNNRTLESILDRLEV